MRVRLARIRNDVVGGVVSAAVAVPLAMGYGMFAFVALGDAYFGHGVLAGLYTAVVVGLVCVVTGDRTTTIYAPRIVTTFFLGSLIFALVHSGASVMRSGGVEQTLAVIFSIILLGGAFQALFGLTRMGTLIKHTPHLVMAGFQNAAALLLFLVQLGNVLGFARNMPFRQFRGLSDAELATVRKMLEPRQYSKGDVVMAEGEAGTELILVVRGTASVHLHREDGRATRLVSFSAGTVVGELAFLDRAPRSATVLADDDLLCYVLTESAFNELTLQHPPIAIRLVVNLAKEMSSRLRRATRTIHHLAS